MPLWVPAGRGAVTPQLSLSYSSQAGNGLLGVGWSLGGLSTISWCGRTIAQDGYTDGGHFDGTGALCLNGTRLVPISPAYSPIREYRTEQESFNRIIAYDTQDNVPDYFKVFTRDGKILTYGGSPNARTQPYKLIGTLATEPSLAREPGAPRATTAWALDRIEDRNGNAATVHYTRVESGAAGLWSMQLRPSEIRYAPNRSVRFLYEGRGDPIDGFAGGTHTRTAARMRRIEMSGGPQGEAAQLLRRYRLTYRSNSITRRSLLRSVTECDGQDNEKCKRSLPFRYSRGSFKFKRIAPTPTRVATNARPLTVVDANGDGRSDLLLQTSGGFLQLATGRASGVSQFQPSAFSQFQSSGLPPTRAFEALDVDADGRTEVLAHVFDLDADKGQGHRYRLYSPANRAATSPSYEPVAGKLGEWRSANATPTPAYLADLDGNGLPDFVETAFPGHPWSYRTNSGASTQDRFAPRLTTDVRRNIAVGNFAVDTNGDGRTELINAVQNPSAAGWASWGLRADSRPPRTPDDVQVRRVNLRGGPTTTHFGDVNGDGLADSVLPQRLSTNGRDGLRVQLNSGNGYGSRFAAPSPRGYRAPLFSGSLVDVGVRVVDFNGDGSDDVLVFRGGLQVYLWTGRSFRRAPVDLDIGDAMGTTWANTQVLDFDGNGAPDLVNVDRDGRLRAFRRRGGVPDRLISVGNLAVGGRTEVAYSTLTDRTVHTPGTRSCRYPLSCLVGGGSVVASHQIISDFGADNEPTWDRYRHSYKAARTDLQGRGWLGFAEHTVTRMATGATTVTRFANATRDAATNSYPFAQLPRKQTYTVKDSKDANAREFRTTTSTDHRLRRLATGTYMVEQRGVSAREQERRAVIGRWQVLRRSAKTISYDDFGNPDVTRSVTANGRTLTDDVDYLNDTSSWLIGLRTRASRTGCTQTGVCRTRESTFDYDPKGNPTVAVAEPNEPALTLTTTTTYGPFGQITAVTRSDSAGESRTETREYNDADQLYPTATINAAGHRSLVQTHSGLGVPLSTTDPNGVETTFRYDRFGRLRATHRTDGSVERISHSSSGTRQRTTTTLAGGGSSAEVVDQLGRTRERRLKAFDGRMATTYIDYDPLGRGTRRTSRPTLPGEPKQFTVTRYDNRGRVTSVTEPNGAQVRHRYHGRTTHTYDARGNHRYTIDTVDGELGSRFEDDPNSASWMRTNFTYGPFGETESVVAPDGSARIMHYDLLARRDRVQDSSSGTTTSSYNAFGEVTSVSDAENRTTTFKHDLLGRVTKRTSPDGVATQTWDTAAHGIGKLAEARSSDNVTIDHTYNEIGQDVSTAWTIEGTRYEFNYAYDSTGRLYCTTYPKIPGSSVGAARLSVGQAYNANGDLARIRHGCAGGDEVYWTAKARNGAGQLTRESLGNGVLSRRVYRPSTGLLERVVATGPGTASKVSDIAYSYDDNHNVVRRTDVTHKRVERYWYDELNRLDRWIVESENPTRPTQSTTYAYDTVGNLKSEITNSPNRPVRTTTYRYGEDGAPPHALTSRGNQSYSFDRAGRQTAGPGRTVRYNSAGLPTVINWDASNGEGRETRFAYDPDGGRVLKRDGDQATVTVAGLFERVTPGGGALNTIHNRHNIVVDGRVVAQIDRTQTASGEVNQASRVTYLHSDLQGSIVALTNRSGKLTGDAESSLRTRLYDPFGRRIDARNSPLRDRRRGGPTQGYTGHVHDDEYGLINMIGRIYDPESRRFLTPDPIQPPISSQSHNRYSYVQNNPATLTDPTGFVWDPPTDGPFGSDTGTGPFNPGPFPGGTWPFPGGTGPFNPGEGPSWLEGILNGSVNETPTSTGAGTTPSSDDDTASTAEDNVTCASEADCQDADAADSAQSDTDGCPYCTVVVGPPPEPDPSEIDPDTKFWVGTGINLAFDAAPHIVNLLPKRFRGAGWIIGAYNLQWDALSSKASTSDIEQIQSAGDIYRDIVGFIPVPQIVIASLVADFLNDVPGGRDSYGDLTNAIGKAVDTWVFPRTPLAELPRTGGVWTATAERRDWLNAMEQLPASAFEVR